MQQHLPLKERPSGPPESFTPPPVGVSMSNILRSTYMRKTYFIYLLPWIFSFTFAYLYWPRNPAPSRGRTDSFEQGEIVTLFSKETKTTKSAKSRFS